MCRAWLHISHEKLLQLCKQEAECMRMAPPILEGKCLLQGWECQILCYTHNLSKKSSMGAGRQPGWKAKQDL